MTILKRPMIIAALIAALSFVFGATAPTTALAAATRIVDDDYPSLAACPGAGYATIQAAVNTVNPGKSGTIKVCAGAYNENVSISNLGKIKLLGQPGATLTPLANTAPLIDATNTKRLTVQGFTLDGLSNGNDEGVIALHDSSGVFSQNVFQNAIDSFGVVALVSNGSRSVKVANNKFTGVGGGFGTEVGGGKVSAKVTGNQFMGGFVGVGAFVNTGAHGALSVTGNYLQGSQYGVQVIGIDKVRVSGNTILDFYTGVYLTESSRSRITGNTVRTYMYGIALGAVATIANSNKVQGNTFEAAANNYVGVYIANAGGAAVDFNQIKGNTITDPGNTFTSTTGIQLINSSGTLHKTLIKGNTLNNMDTMLDAAGDTGTIETGNVCTPTVCVV